VDFERHAISYLNTWKKDKYRKPLVLRGARQVGKTTLVKTFAKNYSHSIFLNLEKEGDRDLFKTFREIPTLVEALLLSNNIRKSQLSETLLFIDEIQELPEAIQSLRYFLEEVPELHVIAAGSLLEFALKEVASLPVGRIETLQLYPLNFCEYLKARERGTALEALLEVPLKPVAHQILKGLFHEYAMLGGMPEVVKAYIRENSASVLPKYYEGIWSTYKDDVEKYAQNNSERKVIRHIMDSAPLYVDQRIKFQNFGNSNYRSREVREAFRNLDGAKIIQLIYPTSDVELPLKPNIRRSPRLQFLDTGLINYVLGIQPQLLGLDDLNDAYKGAIIPHIIAQEIISLNTIVHKKPFFWIREKRQSSAEVDLVVTYNSTIVPIEIKSGATGTLKSLHQFMNRVDHIFAIRMYSGPLKVEKTQTIQGKPFLLLNLPYYLGTQISKYISWFVANHKL
jgi:predicted AAA+ superfamily ATPase